MISRIPASLRHVALQRTVSTTLFRGHCHRRPVGYVAAASFHATSRSAASASDPFKVHPIMQKINESPKVMQQFAEFTMLLQKKGIDIQGKQPGFSEMMKIMSDPEIKESIKKLAQEMQAAGIHLDMQTIAELEKARKEFEDKQEGGGMMNKMKGFFKKE